MMSKTDDGHCPMWAGPGGVAGATTTSATTAVAGAVRAYVQRNYVGDPTFQFVSCTPRGAAYDTLLRLIVDGPSRSGRTCLRQVFSVRWCVVSHG